jgi:hypothetical protein
MVYLIDSNRDSWYMSKSHVTMPKLPKFPKNAILVRIHKVPYAPAARMRARDFSKVLPSSWRTEEFWGGSGTGGNLRYFWP